MSNDIHTSRAAAHFGVVIEQVTTDQRRVGKLLNYMDAYGIDPNSREGRQQLTSSITLHNMDFSEIEQRIIAHYMK